MQAAIHDMSETRGAQSLSRGLAVLSAFSASKREFSVGELCVSLGLTRPTTYRIARTLEQHGFLKFDPIAKTWSVGPTAFAVGNLFLPPSFTSALGEIMRDLRAATTHTVHVAVVDGNSLLNVGSDESQNVARVVSHVGQRSPLHASAAGKAYLASLPTSRVLEIMAETGLPRMASRTITDIDALIVDLERTRMRGYGIAKDERHEGLHSLAMLVGDANTLRPHTIAISMPTGASRTESEEESLVTHLREASARLRRIIGQYQS